LLFLLFVQDIAHAPEATASAGVNVPDAIFVGRFAGDLYWPLLGDRRGEGMRCIPLSEYCPIMEVTYFTKKQFRRRLEAAISPSISTCDDDHCVVHLVALWNSRHFIGYSFSGNYV
jgi:hypothetical protein